MRIEILIAERAMMNAIQQLDEKLRGHLPDCRTMLDPAEGGGPWYLDVSYESRTVNVEWQPARGLGVSLVRSGAAKAVGFSKPDAVFEHGHEAEALAEVLQLLTGQVISVQPFL